MKKYLYLFLLPLVLTFSCKEPEPEPKPQPVEGKITLKSESSVVLSDEGDSKQVAFSATLGWTAASSESWLTVEPRSGQKGDAAITVSASANADYSPRSATVTLVCGEDSKTIEVTQQQKGALLLTEPTIQVGSEGGTVRITAKANSNVSVAIGEDARQWIKDITTKGLIDYIFEFEVSANTERSARSGQIVFSNEYGSETVTIEQAGISIPAEFIYGSSSSLVFGWTNGGTVEEDAAAPYKLELFKDAACTDLQVSFNISAGASCWGGNPLRFVFGGLQPASSYWFKVTNSQSGDVSAPVEGKTAEFTIVDPIKVTSAGAGDLILAEDFSEVAWGPDEEHLASGFFPSAKLLEPVIGSSDHSGYFVEYNSTGRRIYGDTKVTDDKRLYYWGFFGNSAVYAYNGHLRVCTTSSGARTHIVSPALSGIPDGKIATVDVTVTSCPLSPDNDVAVFVNDRTALKLALAPDMDQSTSPAFTSQGGKYTGVSLSNGYALDQPYKQLTTKTVRIEGVNSNSCLVIGSYENVDTKNRFWLDDVKVRIVSIEDTPEIDARVLATTSSTAAFTWTEGESASADVANAYTASLYKDSDCTVVDQSFDFPANLGVWNSKQPRYAFGGLKPSTDYWFKVKDTTNGKESQAVKITTDDFTAVQMPESITGAGVVLAEDFGELRWDFDLINTAVGFRPSDNSNFANTGVKTSENKSGSYIYGGYHRPGGSSELTFKGQGTAINNSRLANWLTDTNVYIHPGYLKLGTASARGWILTPEFTVPEGMAAIVSVSVTAARINTSADSEWCLVVLTPELAKANPGAHTAAFDWPDVEDPELYQVLTFSNVDSWATKSVSGLVVKAGDRIAFGGRKGADASKGRVQISDISVTVTDIYETGNTQDDTQVDGHVLYSNGVPAVGISVSNGFDVTVTDSQGYYTLPNNSDVRYFYISLPSDAVISKNSNGCPDFYKRKIKGCATYDFTLERQAVEDKFLLYALADPQASDSKRGKQKTLDVDRFIAESVPAVNDQISASSLPVYAVTLGDIIYSSGSRNTTPALDIMRSHCAKINCPVFQTIGNHDYTYFYSGSGQELKTDATSSTLFLKAQRSFEDCFGPINYSFNRGNVHVVCMRDIIWDSNTDASSYHGGFTDEQYDWLSADLANVPKSATIIMCVHIPIADSQKGENVSRVLSLLGEFSRCEIFSGHTHYMQKHPNVGGTGIYEHVHTSVCGAWWWSSLSSDGCPNGYTVYEFNGGDIADSYYIGVNKGMNTRDYQMRIYRGGLKYGGKYIYFQSPHSSAEIFINVFNADPYWTVKVYEDDVFSGDAVLMPEVTEYRSDSMYSTVTTGADSSQDWWTSGFYLGVLGLGFSGNNLNPYSWFMDTCHHMYKYTLKNPSASVKVVATDTYGNSYTSTDVMEQDNLYPDYLVKNI